MTKNILKNFLFVERISKDLELFQSQPVKCPSVICLYGKPGIGKTSFAKAWSDAFAYDTRHIAMNELENASQAAKILGPQASLAQFMSDETKPLSRVVILDEFDNLAPKQQDSFKLRLEKIPPREKVVICLNTDERKPLHDRVTPPILSRCHTINFDILEHEMDYFIDECVKRYKFLTREEIIKLGTDQRAMTRENEIASWRSHAA